MEEFRYQQICDFLDGKLSTTEKTALSQWRKANQENEQQFQEVKFIWQKAMLAKEEQPLLKIDVDAALVKVQHQLPPSAKRVPLRRRLLKYVAAASVLLVFGLVTWMTFSPKMEIIQVATATNETKQIKLPDNSTVWLNENSRIRYPKVFAKAARHVSMEGNIIFEVTHNPQQPFVVTTNDLNVKVLGTKFNVQSKTEKNSTALVHVLNGKVEVQSKANPTEKVVLTKEKTAQLDQGQLALITSFSNNQLFWYHQTLTFEETNLQTVIQTLNQAYDTHINLSNKALSACPFTGIFKTKTLAEILETLQLIYGFELKAIHSPSPQLNYGKCQ